MSHIPNSAMKHAAPTHHADETPPATPTPRPGLSGALIALGGTLLVGAVAAVAVPLWRHRSDAEAAPAAKPRARKPAKTDVKGHAKRGAGRTGGSEASEVKRPRRKPAARKNGDS